VGVAVLVIVALVPAGGSAAADSNPAGPRLAVVVVGSSASRPEMLTIGPAGEEPRTIVPSSARLEGFARPIWSADGETLATVGHNGFNAAGVYLMGADGSGLHRLATSSNPGPGTVLLPEPVFDPATGSLVVGAMTDSGPSRMALWSVPVDGSKPHRLGPWSSTRYVHPYSVTPSGKIVAEAEGIKGFAVGVVNQDGSGVRILVPKITREFARVRLNNQATEPAVSPDGTQVAYLVEHVKFMKGIPVSRATNLMMVPIDGGTPKRIAAVKGEARWPSWDPSGSRLAFTAVSRPGGPTVLMEVNADGSCLGTLYKASSSGSVLGATWQPGAERGVGPISC
jgi:hypothetical protein